MANNFKTFINTYTQLSDGTFENNILTCTKTKTAKRNEYILREGEICKEFIFITKGCTRLYYLPNDNEVTVWFGFPNNIGSEIQSFISEKPTKFFIQAIEDTEYISITKSHFDKLLTEYLEWEIFTRKVWEETIINIIDRLTAFQCQTADQRYLDLIKDPDYLQIIPQKYLASYLGVTPTSLSRLRKNISL